MHIFKNEGKPMFSKIPYYVWTRSQMSKWTPAEIQIAGTGSSGLCDEP